MISAAIIAVATISPAASSRLLLLIEEVGEFSGKGRNLTGGNAELGGEVFDYPILCLYACMVDDGGIGEVFEGFLRLFEDSGADGSIGVAYATGRTAVEAHLFLVEKLLEVVPIFVYIGLAVPWLAGFLEDCRIVQDGVCSDDDLDVGVRTMLFWKECA